MNAKQANDPRYDGDLQMFRDSAHEANLEALRFMRWLVEQGRLEHDAAGPPSGEYAIREFAAAA